MDRPGGASENQRQQLIDLLSTDFEPTEPSDLDLQSPVIPLNRFIAQTRIIEQVDRRAASAENEELGLDVDLLLAPAPITLSFKMFITKAIRRAHAWQSPVDDAIAPDRLGLTTGKGIFSAERSQEIEAQVWRGVAADTLKRYVMRIKRDEIGEEQLLILKFSMEMSEEVFDLGMWCEDYRLHYGKSPFGDMDRSAFLAAASKAYIEPDINAAGLTG